MGVTQRLTLESVVETSRRVAEASGRLEKIGLLAALLAMVPAEEIAIAVAYLGSSQNYSRGLPERSSIFSSVW